MAGVTRCRLAECNRLFALPGFIGGEPATAALLRRSLKGL